MCKVREINYLDVITNYFSSELDWLFISSQVVTPNGHGKNYVKSTDLVINPTYIFWMFAKYFSSESKFFVLGEVGHAYYGSFLSYFFDKNFVRPSFLTI